MTLAIETQGLSRSYETYEKPEGIWSSIQGLWNRRYLSKIALQPTTLQIPKGQIVGLVGANGAGKTTLLKILAGLIHPTSGSASVLGHVPWKREGEYLRRISILLGQKNQLWWDIPAMDSFLLLARIYELSIEKTGARAKELAELLDCTHVLNIQLRRLSLGERMKMEIIGSVLHDPEVLFLDEPTIGLDVVAQSTIRKFIAEYVRARGLTVILTSHYMDDIARLADRLLLISKGAIVYDGTVHEFVSKSGHNQNLTVRYVEPLSSGIRVSDKVQVSAGEREIVLQLRGDEVPEVVKVLTQHELVQELKIEEADFEEVIRKFLEAESGILPPRDHH